MEQVERLENQSLACLGSNWCRYPYTLPWLQRNTLDGAQSAETNR